MAKSSRTTRSKQADSQVAAASAVRVAIIGAGGFGGRTLSALQQLSANENPVAQLVGVADKDSVAAAGAGQAAQVPHYTDNRSLLAETRPQIVCLCVPPMDSHDLICACSDRGIHVWKEMPLARSLGEACQIVRRMDQAGLKLAVGTQRRFAPGYRRAWELRQALGSVFLGRAHYLFNWGPNLNWRGDKVSAGGGALLELGYHFIDLMVWMLGLPEEVYGLSAGGNRPEKTAADGKPLPLYDTDDTAAAILRYGKDSMAVVAASRASGPVSEELSLHGRGGSITASMERCLLRDPDGTSIDQLAEGSEKLPPGLVFVRQIESFARAVRDNVAAYECSAHENLLNMAAVEAIYLSDRTGQPESPLRLLRTQGFTIDECLANRPKIPAPGSAATACPEATQQ